MTQGFIQFEIDLSPSRFFRFLCSSQGSPVRLSSYSLRPDEVGPHQSFQKFINKTPTTPDLTLQGQIVFTPFLIVIHHSVQLFLVSLQRQCLSLTFLSPTLLKLIL